MHTNQMEIIHELTMNIKDLIMINPYLWVFIFMTIESTFIPLPSEIIMPPAGYMAAKGLANIYIIILAGIVGSIMGALINYGIAVTFGRKIAKKFIPEKYDERLSHYFEKNGDLTTFVARLLPLIRHYISFPAGLYRMNIKKFVFYTALGSALWVSFLTYFGYWIGDNEELMHKYKLLFFLGVLLFVAIIVGLKILVMKKFTKKAGKQ